MIKKHIIIPTLLILFILLILLVVHSCNSKQSAKLAEQQAAEQQKAEPTPEEMLGQMLMLGFRGDGTKPDDDLEYIKGLIAAGKVGGVIYFETEPGRKGIPRNISSPAQLKALSAALQSAAKIPLFIATDQEGGWVQRLKPKYGFKDWPTAYAMGFMSDAEVAKTGFEMGAELYEAGINLNMAPSVDVNVNPDSPAIGAVGRSFSGDPELVAQKGLAFMQGLNKGGVIGCYKHFPGHGSALADTHLGAADITASWKDYELIPYIRLLAEPGAYAVMVAHVFHTELSQGLPATLSPKVITWLLRQKLGWQGVVFSDDMQMEAIASHYTLEESLLMGIDAGMDIFVYGNNLHYDKTIGEKAYTALLELYKTGKISPERIKESYQRIMLLKARLVAM
ncbi:glycoside hydrolase family 3 protein [Desulfovibrio sp. OttesenSCG-928-F07]|nr:glycoside hydrolase family 3 protein [Desulfovibrio sp. OttesenSCG-928-F07]